MPIDISRSIQAAVSAALEDPTTEKPKKSHLSTGRALLLGAGLMTAGRFLVSSRGRKLLDSIAESLADHDGNPPGDEPDDSGIDDLENDEESQAEADQDFEDEEPEDDEWQGGADEQLEADEEPDEEPERPAPRRRTKSRGR
jgi:hypothetical protein